MKILLLGVLALAVATQTQAAEGPAASRPSTRPTTRPTTRPSPKTAAKPVTYRYNGRDVSQQWFEDRYKEFADKILIAGGKPVLVWREIIDRDHITAAMPTVGKVGLVDGKVAGVTDATVAVWARTSDASDVQVRVSGVDPKKYAEDAPFQELCYFAGMDRNGGKRIREYVLIPRLTKDQFADALAGGFKLVRYAKVKEWRNMAVGGGFAVSTSRQQVEVIKETPIP
jgi:hypothetical protein